MSGAGLVTIGVVFLCGGRGRRGGGGKSLIARCDHAGCSADLLVTGEAEYRAAADAGWRRRGDEVRCPTHSLADGWR
jgi:hypothetical protein